jgi:hypothetical protein
MGKSGRDMADQTTIKMARTSRAGDPDEVQVEIVRDRGQEIDCIRVGLTMEQFAELITGQARVSCEVRRWEKRMAVPKDTVTRIIVDPSVRKGRGPLKNPHNKNEY